MFISFHTSKQARTDKQLSFHSCVSTYGINLTETYLITASQVKETPPEPQEISTSCHFTKSIFHHFTLNNASELKNIVSTHWRAHRKCNTFDGHLLPSKITKPVNYHFVLCFIQIFSQNFNTHIRAHTLWNH